MDRKIKLAATISLLGLTAAACAPNPYYNNGYNYGNRATTTQTGAVNRGAVVSHTHCGRTHSHALPAEGLAHHHGDGCLAGSGGAATTGTNTNNYGTGGNYNNYGYNNQPPATNTNTYGYNNQPGGTPAYDYSAGYGSGSTSSSSYNYSTYAEPKSTNNYNTYTPAPSTSSGNRSTNTSTGSGGSYTVQKGDTVFQVMRNTGVYWKDIIRLNNLQAPNYTIAPGQVLKLK